MWQNFWKKKKNSSEKKKKQIIISKICDDSVLVQLLTSLTPWSSCIFYLKQRFGDRFLSPSSGKSLPTWYQSIELVLISGDKDVKVVAKNFYNVNQKEAGHGSRAA
jgi:hypothetical protein